MDAPTFQTIPLLAINEPTTPDRLWIDPETLGPLADDIAAHGLLQPIGVIGPDPSGRYELVYGHRRLLAHRLLNRGTIEAKVHPSGTDHMTARASENLNREQLTPIEEAHIVARFMARGESRSAIARLMRRSPAWVDQRERLLELPDELQDAVHRDELSIGVASELAAVDHEPYRKQLISEATNNGASLSVVRVWVAHYHVDKARIISNDYAVQEIVEARNAFVPYYRCEACSGDVPFTQTRAMRFCRECAGEIIEATRRPPAPGGNSQANGRPEAPR
jgi:ParB/RepB/Spo0J family partition protein